MDNHVAGLFNQYNILMISWFLINEAFLILIQITISFVFRCEPEYFGFVCINMRLRMATGRTSNNKGFTDCHGEVMTDDWGLTGQI